MKEKYSEIIIKNRQRLSDDYHVKRIGIFGSVAKEKETKKSDVDVLVEFSRPVGFFKFLDLEYFLSKKFGRKVDLVTKKALKPAIKKNVLRDVIYAK